MCVLTFSTTSVWKCLTVRRIQGGIIVNVHKFSCKVPVSFVIFWWKSNLLDRFWKKTRNFMKIRPVGAALCHAGGRDWQAWRSKYLLIAVSRTLLTIGRVQHGGGGLSWRKQHRYELWKSCSGLRPVSVLTAVRPEFRRSLTLRNVGTYLRVHTASRPKRLIPMSSAARIPRGSCRWTGGPSVLLSLCLLIYTAIHHKGGLM